MTSEIIISRGAVLAFFATGVGSSRAARGGGRNKCNLRPKEFPPANPIMSPRGGGRGDEGHFVPSNGTTERQLSMMGSLLIARLQLGVHINATAYAHAHITLQESVIKSPFKDCD